MAKFFITEKTTRFFTFINTISKLLLAIIGIVLGGFLTGVAYSETLGDPGINSVVFVLGIIMTGGGAAYLMAFFIKKLAKW